MSIINVNNSFCSISGFSPKQVKLIKATLTYDDDQAAQELKNAKYQLGMAFRYRQFKKVAVLKAQVADLEKRLQVCWLRCGSFPTGHLRLVIAALDASKVKYSVTDTRQLNAPQIEYKWATEPKPPRYYQDEMVDLAIIHHRGVFSACVGSGKTLTAQMIVHALQVPVLIMVPSKDLCTQTGDDYIQAFGAKMVEVVTTAKQAVTKKPIRICTMQTLTALRKKGDLEAFLEGLGMIIVDEAHHSACSSAVELLPYFNHIYYRFGMSATYLRNDSKTLDLWGFLSTVLYKYPASKAIAEGYLTPFEVVVHDIEGIKGRNYQSEYTKNYCGNKKLLSKIKRIFETHVGPGEQTLILVGRKDQSGKIIHEFLKSIGIENEYVSGDCERDYVKQALINFNSKKTKVLIGSSVVGEGIDIRSSNHLLMAQGGKSEIAITQAVGRLVRLFEGKTKGYLHDLRFIGTKYLETHLSHRLDIYAKNFGVDISKIDLTL